MSSARLPTAVRQGPMGAGGVPGVQTRDPHHRLGTRKRVFRTRVSIDAQWPPYAKKKFDPPPKNGTQGTGGGGAEIIPLWVLQGSRVLVIVPAVPVTSKTEAGCPLDTVFSGHLSLRSRKAHMIPLTRLLLC